MDNICISGNNDSELTSRSLLKDFTNGSLTQPFISKWDSTIDESAVATAGMTSLLVELIGVTA